MKTFANTENRTWEISLTIDSAKRVRNLLDVNLLELEAGDPPLLTRLGIDVILLCDVIFALVKPQADQQNVTDEQFGAALGGEAILAAQAALYEELVLFFQGLGRKDVARAVEKQKQMIDLAVQQIETRIEEIDVEAVVETTLGELSTNSPASSESTPDP